MSMHYPSHRSTRSSLLHPHTLSGSLCAASSLALHPLDREAAAISTGLRVVALCMSLLAAESILLILLGALVVRLAIASSALARLGVVVEGDVEEVFFVGVADLGTLSL